MNIPEFLDRLQGTCDQFDWALHVDRSPGSERRTTERFCIRGTLRNSSPALVLDPLRAVYYAQTGKLVGRALCHVADALQMPDQMASMILAATNDRTWSGSGSERVHVQGLQAIRERLLEAVGLRFESTPPTEACEPESVAF